jgi:SAM-dependent methyltransferase/predicted nuclease with TOPRIM domain
MFEIKDDEINVDELMLRIREEAARKSAEAASSSASLHNHRADAIASAYAPAPGEPFTTQTPFHARSDDRYTLHELLKYYDREFVENAYRAVLKREPDRAGLTEYLEHLRGGRFDRIDILARLRASLEGREKNVKVEGLYFPSQLRRLYRLPLVGYFVERLAELWRLPLALRSQRRFEAYSMMRQERIVARINQLIEETHEHFQRLREETGRLDEAQLERTAALSERLEAHAQTLSRQIQELRERAQSLDQKLETRAAALDEKLETRAHAANEQLRAEAAQLRAEANALANGQARELQSQAEEFRAEARRLEDEAARLKARADELSQKLQVTRTELSAQERRSLLLLEEARKLSTLSPGHEQRPGPLMIEETEHFLDAFYSSFEEHFRGSREEIMKRLEVYLPTLRKANITGDILDIGCGRGEWLEVLKNEGVAARGVDSNRVQVEWCRERALEVEEGDALRYLRAQPDESINVVTAFHVAEHLEFETLLAFLYEIMRVLRPGGLVIFETPNPENVSVANHNFYVDPTHKNPLPIPMMKFLFESRGLDQIEIIKLHPSETPRVEGATDMVERFNEYFYGPMDYAIIGRKV